MFWGPVGSASTSGFAHLSGSSIFGVTSFFSLQFGMRAAGLILSCLARSKGAVCIRPGRSSRSWRGCLSMVSSGLLECYPSFWDEALAGGRVFRTISAGVFARAALGRGAWCRSSWIAGIELVSLVRDRRVLSWSNIHGSSRRKASPAWPSG